MQQGNVKNCFAMYLTNFISYTSSDAVLDIYDESNANNKAKMKPLIGRIQNKEHTDDQLLKFCTSMVDTGLLYQLMLMMEKDFIDMKEAHQVKFVSKWKTMQWI